jgi:hypothetical protein
MRVTRMPLGHNQSIDLMDLPPTSRTRKPLHFLAPCWVCISSILLWVRGRDLLEWAIHAPFWELLLLQVFNSGVSAVFIVEFLPTFMASCERWNQRQRLRAVWYIWGIIFVVSSAMVLYGLQGVH